MPKTNHKIKHHIFVVHPGRVLGLQTGELLALRRELLILLCKLLPQSLNLFRSAIIMRRRSLRRVGRR